MRVLHRHVMVWEMRKARAKSKEERKTNKEKRTEKEPNLIQINRLRLLLSLVKALGVKRRGPLDPEDHVKEGILVPSIFFSLRRIRGGLMPASRNENQKGR